MIESSPASTVSANAYLPCAESYFNKCANILGLVKSLIATTSYPSALNICLNARRPIRPNPLIATFTAILLIFLLVNSFYAIIISQKLHKSNYYNVDFLYKMH